MSSDVERPIVQGSTLYTVLTAAYQASLLRQLLLPVLFYYSLLKTAYTQSATTGCLRRSRQIASHAVLMQRMRTTLQRSWRQAARVHHWLQSPPSTQPPTNLIHSKLCQKVWELGRKLTVAYSTSHVNTGLQRVHHAFLRRATSPRSTPTRLAWFFVIGIGTLLRLQYATLVPIHDDSLHYYREAYQLVHQSVLPDEHFIVLLLMGGFMLIFGSMGANLASLVASITTIPVLGAASSRLFDSQWTGVATGLVFAVMPMAVYYASWAYTDPIALFIFSLGLYCIIARKYLLTLAVLPIVFYSRYEYLTILLPLLGLTFVDRKTTRALLILTLPNVIGSLIIASLFHPSVYGILQGIAGSTSFFPNTFYHFAREHGPNLGLFFASRFDYYVYHFLHWGVPYWHLELVNPLLPALFALGVIASLHRTWYVLGVSTMAFLAVGGGLVYRETLAGPQYLTTFPELMVTVGVAVVFCVAAIPLCQTQERTRPLSAVAGYIAVLSVAWPQARYLLPVLTVGTLYAGYGLYIAISNRDTLRQALILDEGANQY